MLAEDDPVKMEMDIIDEQVDTVGRVFMGLTLGCARCHDHKFDPIPTADYYALAGIFKSTKSMQNHNVVAMWNERPLATPEPSSRLDAHKKEVARRTGEIDARVEQARAAAQRGQPRTRRRLPRWPACSSGRRRGRPRKSLLADKVDVDARRARSSARPSRSIAATS